MSHYKMLLFAVVAVYSLVQGSPVDASLDLLPILRQNKLSASAEEREVPDMERARGLLQPLPGSYSSSEHREFPGKAALESDDSLVGDNDVVDNNDVTVNNLQRLSHLPLAKNNKMADDALNRMILELLRLLTKVNPSRQHPLLGKRLWGQRRNVQTRFASFGTKLVPSRKTLLGNSGSTILRYGRSVHH